MKYTVDKANKYIQENKHKVNQTYRLKYHLMPEIGWMNDPNGLIYINGEYHVFYQHYPYDSVWGPMHWGHAVSRDLISWEAKGVAIAPDKPYEEGCFSGGSVIYQDELYLLYTSHKNTNGQSQVQSLATSKDYENFKKYENNPVINSNLVPNGNSTIDFRDPNSFEVNGNKYILIGSKTDNNKGQFLIYKTNDYKSYEYFSKIKPHPLFGDMGECPDFFKLGNKFVLLFSATNLKQKDNNFRNDNSSLYAIGDFDDKKGDFKIEYIDEIDLGHHFYAPQTLLNDKNERIMIAWMEMWNKRYYTDELNHHWLGAMTLPRVLTIENNKLIQRPIALDKYLSKTIDLIDENINQIKLLKQFNLTLSSKNKDFKIFFKEDNLNYIKIEKIDNRVNIDLSNNEEIGFSNRYFDLNDENIKLDIYVDTSSIEVFINDGIKTITNRFYLKESEINLIIDDLSKFDKLNLNIYKF